MAGCRANSAAAGSWPGPAGSWQGKSRLLLAQGMRWSPPAAAAAQEWDCYETGLLDQVANQVINMPDSRSTSHTLAQIA
jgi:hypothetical protein